MIQEIIAGAAITIMPYSIADRARQVEYKRKFLWSVVMHSGLNSRKTSNPDVSIAYMIVIYQFPF